MPLYKSKKATASKKANSQKLAIQGRRNLVDVYLTQHLTPRQIHNLIPDVKLATIESDIKALARGYSSINGVVAEGKKQRELDELDMMEHDAQNQLEEKLLYIAETLADKSGLQEMGKMAPKILQTIYSDAGSWWDRILKVKQYRGKLLGFEIKEATPAGGETNNTINLTIKMPDGTEDGKSVSFGEWAEGQFREVGKELPPGEE